MDLNAVRERINAIDDQIVDLFVERMKASADVASAKAEKNLPVLDLRREQAVLEKVMERGGEEFEIYINKLYQTIFDISKSYQAGLLTKETALSEEILKNIADPHMEFPRKAVVACQGVEGAYSEQACERLFKRPSTFFFSSFEAVFSAIEKGLCRYGVIPLENSTAGSVNAVYDLMMQHNFRIVRSVRLKIDHCLLAKPGTKLSDIKEIYSHEQAISQCGRFLQSLPGVTVVRCENTAVAAKRVAESDRTDVAALSPRACVGLYGLERLAPSVQDQGNNYTRCICYADDLESYPGAGRTGLMMGLPHKPGSLYKVLSRFYALGINLNKLESRPLPERDFEFMFYFDLETSVYSPQFQQLMGELPVLCEEFSYLGSYREVV